MHFLKCNNLIEVHINMIYVRLSLYAHSDMPDVVLCYWCDIILCPSKCELTTAGYRFVGRINASVIVMTTLSTTTMTEDKDECSLIEYLV